MYIIDTIIWYNNLGNLSNANHKFLKTAVICQPHVSIFLDNLFGNLNYFFCQSIYITNTYFTLKCFIIFDKTIFHRK